MKYAPPPMPSIVLATSPYQPLESENARRVAPDVAAAPVPTEATYDE